MTMPALPGATVIIPTRNRAPLLRVTLEAVRRQRDVDLQVLVVDDASTDDTPGLVSSCGDQRVRLLTNDRRLDVSGARNRGIEAAESEWIAFCDDDDLWSPDKVRAQLQAARASSAPWACAGSVGFAPSGRILFHSRPPRPEVALGRLARRNVIPGGCSNVVVRRELVAEVGGFDPRMRTLADWDLWVRLARQAAPAVVDEPLVGYRLHEGNMSSDPAGVLQEFRLIEDATRDLRGGSSLDPAWLHRWLGQAALRGGARWTAVACYARAARWRQPESFGRPVVALFGHRMARYLEARRRPVDAEWASRARPWLDELLAQPVSTSR